MARLIGSAPDHDLAVLRLAVLPLVLAALLLDAAAAWAGRLLEALPGPWHAIPAPGGA